MHRSEKPDDLAMSVIDTKDDFDNYVGIVVWTAEWCAACPSAKYAVDQHATRKGIPAAIADVVNEELAELVAMFGFRSLPVVQAVVDGTPVAQKPGVPTASDISDMAKELRRELEKRSEQETR